MGNIQNRKREYMAGLTTTNIAFLIKEGKLEPMRQHELIESFLDRACKVAQHFQDLEEQRRDPQRIRVERYIQERGW